MQTTPTDQGPSPRSRVRRATTFAVGTDLSRSSSSVRHSRISAPARRAPSPSRASPAGEWRREVCARRRRVQAAELRRGRAHDRPLDLPRSARLDQLAGNRAQERLRDGAGTHWPEPAQLPDALAEEWVARVALEKLRVVIVEPEREPHVVDAGVARGRDDHRAVGLLQRVDALELIADADRRAIRARADDPGRIACMPARRRREYGPFGRSSARTTTRVGHRSPDAAPGRVARSLRSRERKLRVPRPALARARDERGRRGRHRRAVRSGGSSDNFFEAMYPWPERITAVGNTELDRFAAAFPRVRAVRADGRELPFADGAFDLGFSNAVVEHVAGGRDGSGGSSHELCRVARRVFVTTPNRWFPLEPHTLLPLVHWLPAGARDALMRAASTTCSTARPKRVRVALSLRGARTEPRMTLVAVGPA